MKTSRRKFVKQLSLIAAGSAILPSDLFGASTQLLSVDYDVIVVGGGISGIAATIAAARKGARILLIEQEIMLGGSWTYAQNLSLKQGRIVGIYKEIFTYLNRYHSLDNIPDGNFEENPGSQFRFFHKTGFVDALNRLFQGTKNVTVMRNTRVTNVMMTVGTMTKINGVVYYQNGKLSGATANVIIDATAGGTVASMSGCLMMFGTEGKAVFNELNAPDNSSEEVRPAAFQMVIHRTKSKATLPLSELPGSVYADKTGDLKASGAPGYNKDIQGVFLWKPMEINFDPRVVEQWGQKMAVCYQSLDAKLTQSLEKRGFNVEYPGKLHQRESQRIVGEYVLTANDIDNGTLGADAIFLNNIPVQATSATQPLSGVQTVAKEYGIPYRSIIPKDIDGLLCCAPAMSGSHLALSSYQNDNCVCAIAEAAGVAAALSVHYNTPLREVYNINEFRCYLFEQDLMPY